MSPRQRTLQSSFSLEGVGLHSGQAVACSVLPAPVGHGIRFQRIDKPDSALILAHWSNVVDSRLSTTLEDQGCRVATVEHLLSALWGMGIDNALVQLDQPETPVIDGSARPWVDAIERVGSMVQGADAAVVRVDQVQEYQDGPRRFRFAPGKGLCLEVEVDFTHPAIGVERLEILLEPSAFRREVAWARTFAFEKDLTTLQEQGLALGGSLDNALLFGAEGVINPCGVRGEGEVVRHKTLDLIGDLALCGARLEGRIAVRWPGHAFTHACLKKMFSRLYGQTSMSQS